MERVARVSKRLILSYRTLPDKKQYLEFFTALLSIPVLLTVILLNVNNLNALKNNKPTDSVKQQDKIIIVQPTAPSKSSDSKIQPNNSTAQAPCKKEIGPVDITDPKEGETILVNPVSIDVNYQTGIYCAIVWAYRINGGSWSGYDDKSLALYNLPQGKITVELKVKSIVTGDETTLTRNFIYNGSAISITPTNTPTLAQGGPSGSSSAH